MTQKKNRMPELHPERMEDKFYVEFIDPRTGSKRLCGKGEAVVTNAPCRVVMTPYSDGFQIILLAKMAGVNYGIELDPSELFRITDLAKQYLKL